jgi:hypothetical protein
MSINNVSIKAVFEHLRLLREKVAALALDEENQVVTLEGHQTPNSKEAIHLSFAKLQDQIAGMEEILATIAEATGEIPKL